MPKSTLVPPPDWSRLDLVSKLKEPYKGALKRVYQFVRPLMMSPLGGEEFTDHDIDHTARVTERIGRILPKNARLNQSELYVLLLASLLHDWGMWTSKTEAHALLDDAEFVRYFEKHDTERFQATRDALGSDRWRWMGELALQRLAIQYHRRTHPARIREALTRAAGPQHEQEMRTLIDPEFLAPVALVAEAHGWDRERVLDDRELEPREFGGELVNLRYLAELLRLGDLLDLGDGRISTLVWDYLRPLSAESESHWRKEATLRVERCEPDLIRISGTFDVVAGGTQAAEAYRLACDWLDWLDAEIKGCALLLPSRMEPELRSRCKFGDLQLEIGDVKAKGLELGGKVSFELDLDRILALLGGEIYSQGSVFVRELLQNAVDATRAQMIRDHRAEIEAGKLPYPDGFPWDWPLELTGQDRYEIDITTGEEIIDGIPYETFSIADKGIGMTTRQITENFLQVGKSYYKTPQFGQEFRHTPISQFGIGFLSCLTVADRIEVVTRPRGEAFGLRLKLALPSKHFTIEKAADAPLGTRVSLWFGPHRPRPENWDSPPLGGEDPSLEEAPDRRSTHGRRPTMGHEAGIRPEGPMGDATSRDRSKTTQIWPDITPAASRSRERRGGSLARGDRLFHKLYKRNNKNLLY